MKHTRKLVSFLLTLIMVLSMSVTAFAAEQGTTNEGKITINNAVAGETYSIYKIMDLESFSKGQAYSYKAVSAWETWLRSQSAYVTFNTEDYVSWVKNADAEAFAKAALAYAKENADTITATDAKTAENATVTFENLTLGYYLVDSSLGALCFLDTTDKEVEIEEKNTVPTIEKKVQEGEIWGASNTAKIGDTVNFMVTIHGKKGAENYVLHDTMSDGFTFNGSVTVKVNDVDLAAENYTLKTENLTEAGTFEIAFTKEYLETMNADTDIVITYSATLNSNAAIYENTNDNIAKLTYGDASETAEAKTTTATLQFDIVKTDSSNKLLSGAEFKLYDAQTEGNEIPVVKESEGVYRVATEEEKTAPEFVSVVIEAGKVTVKGLDANTSYWLEETKAPAGYNKLPGRVEVKMETGNLTAVMNEDNTQWVSGGVHIVNNTGTELPSTGGIGTTIFYVAGSVLVLAAVVLLITKKRMSTEK